MATREASPSTQVTIIEPPPRWPTLGLRELWSYRRVCLVMAQRSIKARYRSTVLGVVWVLFQPLLYTAIFTIFWGLFLQTDTHGVPHAPFYLSGMVAWQVVARVFGEGRNSILSNGSIVQRTYLPKAVLPISVALASLVDLVFLLLALTVCLAAYGIAPNQYILLTPIFLAVLYAAALGVTFLFAVLGPRYRDLEVLAPLLLQAWFFLSPIIYSAASIPQDWRAVYYLNPVALAIDGIRWAWLGAPAPPPVAWLVSPIAAVAMLVGGYLFFRRHEPLLADAL